MDLEWKLGWFSKMVLIATKTDQEIIISRKHKSGLEIEVLRLYQSGVEMQGFEHYGCMTTKNALEIGGVILTQIDDNKKRTRRCIE